MNLVVIAAGRGSRFLKSGIIEPKPLVIFNGKPLFWWAAKSAMSDGSFDSLHFAVLVDHVLKFEIDKVITEFFPNAIIHIIDRVTSGAAETASIVAKCINGNSPVAFLDCDLTFEFEDCNNFLPLFNGYFSAAICVFESSDPAYSYVKYNEANELIGTIEKEVVSNHAIAGLYAFETANVFLDYYYKYASNCPYKELYMSGILNEMIRSNQNIQTIPIKSHLSLGTPAELEMAKRRSVF